MPILLGIDTGGTYTDAVLLDDERGILDTAKSPTTKFNLTIGIENAVRAVLPDRRMPIQLVSLSSTLATNAIVEGKGNPACLILIGYDTDVLNSEEFKRIQSDNPVVFVKGGHELSGKEREPLDRKGLREAILSNAPHVSAFAVSGYFSVRNSSHELLARSLVRELTNLPITCGHELTSHLNAPVRAVTALLNARLIPLMRELIVSVQDVLSRLEIRAPLMIVKGDGSLIASEIALCRPIETIVSGPAASIVGARYLSGYENALVIDMGGTTSDIAAIRGGFPILCEQGLSVDGFRTMVSSIDVRTEGLGGDSVVSIDKQGIIRIGPKRVIPLCVLGEEHPGIIDVLKGYEIDRDSKRIELPRFIIRQRSTLAKEANLSAIHREILDAIDDVPISQLHLLERAKYPSEYLYGIDVLIERGFLMESSFTPTDAISILGYYRAGSEEAASYGAELLARMQGIGVEDLCREIMSQVIYQLGHLLISSAMYAEGAVDRYQLDKGDSFFMDRALRGDDGGIFSVSISMKYPLVAVGAPVITYMPQVASLLNSDICIPEHADVANAVGSVVGSVLQSVRVVIKPQQGRSIYRVHIPDEMRDFKTYNKAVQYAQDRAVQLAEEHAISAGAQAVKTNLEMNELIIESGGVDKNIHIETEIIAVSIGRPSVGR
jgi:N-methylhydantoinase A/oxoprolinase/acetone carboxylase beta subunit